MICIDYISRDLNELYNEFIMRNFKCNAALLIAIVACLGLTSCHKLYYQVYNVNSNSLNQEDNSMVYENSELKILYNLWGENGTVGFIVKNKTDKDLFLDMNQTFFILNGAALEYYKNREYTNIISSTSTLEYGSYISPDGFWPTRYYVPSTAPLMGRFSRGSSTSITTKEKEVLCIPSNSFKAISEFEVAPRLQQICNPKTDFPKRTATIASYNEKTSPIKFRNRISYSFDKDCKNLKQIENDFYVSDIVNYSHKVAVEKVTEKINCYDLTERSVEHFKIGGPNKFYKTYVRKK